MAAPPAGPSPSPLPCHLDLQRVWSDLAEQNCFVPHVLPMCSFLALPLHILPPLGFLPSVYPGLTGRGAGTSSPGRSRCLLLHPRGVSPTAGAVGVATSHQVFVGKTWLMEQACANLSQAGLGSGEMFLFQKVDVKSFMLQSKSCQELPFSSLHPCLFQDPSMITGMTHSVT